jgi:hypothetical protein
VINLDLLRKIKAAGNSRSPIYTSVNFGTRWNKMEEKLPYGAQVSFMSKIKKDLIFGTDNMGLFLREQNKSAWIQIGNKLPGKKINAIHVSNNVRYVSVYGQGIFVSNNKVITCRSLNYNLENLKVRAIIKIRDQLFAGTDDGIFKFIGGINVWQSVAEGVQINSFNQYEGEIMAGTNPGVLLSDHGLKNWNWIHRKGAEHNTEVLNGQVFIMYMSGELYIAQDANSLLKVDYSSEMTSTVYDIVLFQNHLIMSNSDGIHESTGNGRSWSRIYKTNDIVIYDFLVIDNILIGGKKKWVQGGKNKC